jgi:Ca2+-binding RTX toxin-like protein
MEGNDYYLCGKGNDSIDDSFGDETYIFNKGDGQDTIFDTDGVDTVVFGTGCPRESQSLSGISGSHYFVTGLLIFSYSGWCDGSSLS